MKRRIIIKKIKQSVGACPHCYRPIFNWVTNSDYKGSCIYCDEDFFGIEILGYHRRGTPLLMLNKYKHRINNYLHETNANSLLHDQTDLLD